MPVSSQLLRIVLVEDDPADAALIESGLAGIGVPFECRRVGCRSDYTAALDAGADVVLADYTLPGFDALEALRLLRERCSDTPFLVVSGTIGEERAVEILRDGADDYLLKDRLQRLPDAVRRALEVRHLLVEHERTKEVAREALLRQQMQTEYALEAGGVGIWTWDASNGRATWSRTLEELHGLAPGTFSGTMEGFLACIHADDRPAVASEIGRAIDECRDASLEYRTAPREGHERTIICKGRFFRDAAGSVTTAVGIGMDVTERRDLQAQLIQSQKMEAIGRLAGGIAHDFNNLLTAILGYAELLTPVLKSKPRHGSDLEQIKTAATRATRLTRQLLAFSRRQMLQPVVIDLNALVTDASTLLGRLIGEDIRLTLKLDPSIGRTKADPGQIEQVIVNLVVNARDAMPSGGILTIETANIDVDDQFFRRHAFRNEGDTTRFVVLTVSDTGCGMDDAVKKRIFEPFFTTKPKGQGTGLGLATVYGIVKQSGGSIWVYAEPGQGSTFRIYLPRTGEPLAVESPPAIESKATRGRETILLVEDEESVRRLTRALLERSGYRVLEAPDAERAMKTADTEQGRIDLLLTDVVMPGRSGRELYDYLAPRRPEMQVLYLSGYTDEAIVRRGVFAEGTPFLQKPFTAAGLATKVRELLDAPRVPS